MALGVLPEDKPKIAFNAAMMWVQNFGFFLMYLMMWIFMPKEDKCNSLRFWVGFFSLDCFLESFVCLWMGMAGFTDDSTLFPVMWILHLVVPCHTSFALSPSLVQCTAMMVRHAFKTPVC